MTQRFHLFPFRTQKLSSVVPKIVGWRRPAKIGRCRLSLLRKATFPQRCGRVAFFVVSHGKTSPGPEKTNSCRKLYRGENAFWRSIPAMTAAEHPGRAGLRVSGIFSLGRCKPRRFRKRKNPPNPLRSGDRGTEKKFWSTPDSPQLSAPAPCSQLHPVDRRHSGARLFPRPFPAFLLLVLGHHF